MFPPPVQPANPVVVEEVAPASPSLGFSWDRRWVASIALIALVFAAFWPSLSADFVNWDDDRNFVFNDHYRGLGPANLWWMWTSYHMAQWHPLTWMTLGLDWCLWGPDAAGYHLTNVVIHALAALAAFFFVRRLFAHVRPQASADSIDLAAFFAAAFFAIHPLRVESVAWVTERRDVLSGLFAFLTLGAWLRYVDAGEEQARKRAWIQSWIFFLLAALSKVSVFVMPGILLLLDLWPLRRWGQLGLPKLLWEKRAHILVALPLPFIAFLCQYFTGAMYTLEDHPLPPRLVHAGFSFFFYPVKTFKPTSLMPMYEMPPDVGFFTPPFLIPAAIGVGVLLVMLFLYRRAPALSSAWAWFAIFVFPVCGLSQAGSQIAADRYSYLSCASFTMLVAGALFLFTNGRTAQLVGATLGGLLVATLGVMTFRQCGIWNNSRALWEHTLALQPSSSFALDELGHLTELDSRLEKDPKKKIAMVERAIEYHRQAFNMKGDVRHLLNGAAALRALADADEEHFDEHVKEAFEQVQKGFELADEQHVKHLTPWYRTRGSLYLDVGRFEDAVKDLRLYLEENPKDGEAQLFLGMALVQLKRGKEAMEPLQRDLDQYPKDVRAWAAMADALALQGIFAGARQAWLRVIEIQQQALGAEAEADPYVQAARVMLPRLESQPAPPPTPPH